MLIFLTFMPMDIGAGAISGAIGFGIAAVQDRVPTQPSLGNLRPQQN
jgi:hypothetical protein